jgi:hypothetical protein
MVERFARARERRADIRSLIGAFRENVDAIVSDGIAYYQMPGASPQAMTLAALIKARLQSLNDQILAMREVGLPINVDQQLKSFRRAVTGGEFETFNRAAEPTNSHVYAAITSAGSTLANAVQLELFRFLGGKGKARKAAAGSA